jgi:hypothetical protein
LEQAATLDAFLPAPDRRLDGEIQLGSLAFPRDAYRTLRDLLVKADALDAGHVLLHVFQQLLTAPLKTILLLRRGKESTYAKKEMGFFNAAPCVAVHWNANDPHAYTILHTTLRNVVTWMNGDRTAAYPSPPIANSSLAKPKIEAEKSPENPLAAMFKPKATLDFSGEVLGHKHRK